MPCCACMLCCATGICNCTDACYPATIVVPPKWNVGRVSGLNRTCIFNIAATILSYMLRFASQTSIPTKFSHARHLFIPSVQVYRLWFQLLDKGEAAAFVRCLACCYRWLAYLSSNAAEPFVHHSWVAFCHNGLLRRATSSHIMVLNSLVTLCHYHPASPQTRTAASPARTLCLSSSALGSLKATWRRWAPPLSAPRNPSCVVHGMCCMHSPCRKLCFMTHGFRACAETTQLSASKPWCLLLLVTMKGMAWLMSDVDHALHA